MQKPTPSIVLIPLLLLTLFFPLLAGCAAPPTPITPTPTAIPSPTPTHTPGGYYSPPIWAQGAVIYQLFFRAFTPEGTIEAATARLPELQALGVDIIMLLPIHPVGEEKRVGTLGSPYSIRSYRTIDHDLGSFADFRAFVETAHRLDMHVIMDFVANHTAWDNFLITDHPDWYNHNAAGDIISPNKDWLDVADLNYKNDGLRLYMLDTALFWVDEFAIDGYRADASNLVPNDFWKSWRNAVKPLYPRLLLLSESDGLDLYRAGFEVAYDWDTRDKFIQALKNPKLAIAILPPIVKELEQTDYQVWRMRYLENHDQDRIAQVATTPEQQKLAAAFLLSLPGLPLIYNGQEVGLTERPSIFDVSKIDWSLGDETLRAVYTTLIQLRHTTPALQKGDLEIVKTNLSSVVAFTRATPEQRILVLLNFDSQPAELNLPDLPKGTDLLTGEMIDLSEVSLDGYGYQFVQLP